MIEWAEVDGIAVLTLARPPVNALDAQLCTAVADGLRGPRAEGVRAVVLTGAGRAFSAGVDLRSVVDGERSIRDGCCPRSRTCSTPRSRCRCRWSRR